MSGTAPRVIAQADINTALSNPFVIGGPATIAGAFTLGFTLTANTTLTLPTSGTLATVGGSSGQVQINSGGALAGLPVGLSGVSTIVQTTAGGLLTPSIIPIATTGSIGGIIPDGTTISVNATTGVATAIGGAATSVVVGTTTVGGGSPGQVLFNSGGTLGSLGVTGTGNAVLATNAVLVTPNLGTPSALTLTSATGLPVGALTGLGTGVAGSLTAAVTGSGGSVLAISPTLVTPNLGIPTALTLTSATGLLITGIAGLGTGMGASMAVAVTGSGGSVLATAPTISNPVLSGGTADGLIVGGVTPAAMTATNFNFTGSFSFNGSVLLKSINTGQSLTVGLGAGAVLPANDAETMAVGTNALGAYTAAIGENTAYGWGSGRSLTGSMVSVVTTAQAMPGTPVINVNDTGANFVGALANGYFAIAPGIPDGTTVVSFTPNPTLTITLSTSVTLTSGVTIYFAPVTATTNATTTAGNVLNFVATTGIVVGQVVVASGGANAYPAVSVTGVTSTTVTLNAPVTVASGTACYFATHSGQFNTLVGVNTLGLSTQDSNNTLVGVDCMRDATGGNNTSIGATNMRDGIHYNNTVVGFHALWASGATNAYTFDNVAIGVQAMGAASITTANSNVVIGYMAAGNAITSASNNVLIGFQVGAAINSGNFNASGGYQSLAAVNSGGSNSAWGALALNKATTANFLVGIGRQALGSIVTGWYHTAVGSSAMGAYLGTGNTAAAANVAVGANAGLGTSSSTYTDCALVGTNAGIALTTGNLSTFLGANTGAGVNIGTNNTIIGANVGSVNLVGGIGNIYLGSGQAFGATTIDAPAPVSTESWTLRLGANVTNLMRATAINTATPAMFFDWLVASGYNFANDAAAATGGILVGQVYRNGSVVMLRVA